LSTRSPFIANPNLPQSTRPTSLRLVKSGKLTGSPGMLRSGLAVARRASATPRGRERGKEERVREGSATPRGRERGKEERVREKKEERVSIKYGT
jgi:hypothetical protein